MKIPYHTVLLTLGLSLASVASAQTVLNATFDRDPVGLPPIRNLPGLPIGDELLYLGSGSYLRVVPFPGDPASRAAEIRVMPGTLNGSSELASTTLFPGGRSYVRASSVGQMASPVKFGSLILSLSLDSTTLLAVVELNDGQVYFHQLAADGTTFDRRRFATYRPGVTHEIELYLDVKTGKCHASFQERGAPLFTSLAVRSPAAPAVGNANHLSMVYNYNERQLVKGAYLLDEAQMWVNHP